MSLRLKKRRQRTSDIVRLSPHGVKCPVCQTRGTCEIRPMKVISSKTGKPEKVLRWAHNVPKKRRKRASRSSS